MQPIKKLLGPKNLLLLAVTFTILITIAFLLPGRSVPPTRLPIDKVVHIAMNAGLAILWLLVVFKRKQNRLPITWFFTILIACVLYGIVIEVIQEHFIPLRHGDVWDLLANSAGIALGAILFYRVRNYFGNQI